MSETRTILILGACSHIGRMILNGLLSHTKNKIVATGRDRSKLERLMEITREPRCVVQYLDAYDFPNLRKQLAGVSVVVNCVGPYDLKGAEIAETVLASGASYIDYAYEQIHYKKCLMLDSLARAKNQFLLVGAGMTSGLTTLFIKDILSKIPQAREIDFFHAEGSLADPSSGWASILSGALEASRPCESFTGSTLKPFSIGSVTKKELMPPPFNTVEGLLVPTIDDLVVAARKMPLCSVKTYFAMGVPSPRLLFTLLRITKPLSNALMYRVFSRVARNMIKKSYQRQRQEGMKQKPVMKITVKTETERAVKFVHYNDDRNATSFLPVLFLKKWSCDGIALKGLINILDVMELDFVIQDLKTIGWNVVIEDFSIERL
jgi:hypothetical protein